MAPDQVTFPLQEFLGFELDHGGGRATARMAVGAPHLNPNGAAHGATLYAMIDTAMGAATVSALEPGQHCATIEMHVRFLRPVFSGELVADAVVISRGKRIVHLESKVAGGDGRLVAAATASFAVIAAPSPAGSSTTDEDSTR